jgi:hypothetical protein
MIGYQFCQQVDRWIDDRLAAPVDSVGAGWSASMTTLGVRDALSHGGRARLTLGTQCYRVGSTCSRTCLRRILPSNERGVSSICTMRRGIL